MYGILQIAATKLPPSPRKEVNLMEVIITLIISIVAEVIAYFLCKWLDEDD